MPLLRIQTGLRSILGMPCAYSRDGVANRLAWTRRAAEDICRWDDHDRDLERERCGTLSNYGTQSGKISDARHESGRRLHVGVQSSAANGSCDVFGYRTNGSLFYF